MVSKRYKTITIPIARKKLDLTHCTNRDMDVLKTKPVVYIYFSNKSLYVGQTIGFLSRHAQHVSKRDLKVRYDGVIILFGEYVDLNSQSDLEGQLISYLKADNRKKESNPNRRKVMNGKNGNRVVDYTARNEVLSDVLIPFWTELKQLGLVYETSLKNLRKRLLFKYSPFTLLSEEQGSVIEAILKGDDNHLIQGCAGTGKTVVLTNLVARLSEQQNKNYKIGVAVKRNWIGSVKDIFRSYAIKENVTVGTPYQIIKDHITEKFDIVIVDEAHRLRWHYPKQMPYQIDIFKGKPPHQNELYFLGEKAKRLVLLYDVSGGYKM